jgi:hypothetical protein
MDGKPGDQEDHRVVDAFATGRAGARLARGALLLAALLAGCGSYTSTIQPVRDSLRNGDPRAALEEFDAGAAPDSAGRDRLLFLMEKGNLLRLAGLAGRAEPLLLEADRLSDMQRGVDLAEEAGALLTSDATREFRGADYEKVMINYVLASCYVRQDDLEEALVECRRVGEKLTVLNDAYTHENVYRDDAFVRWLMGVMFEAAGDLDDALVAYRNSLRVYEDDYAEHYGLGPPVQVASDVLRLCRLLGLDDLYSEYASRYPEADPPEEVPAGSGQLVLVMESGRIPEKVERDFTAYAEDRVYRVALPAMPEKRVRRHYFDVSVAGRSRRAWLAEDLVEIARKNLEDQAARDLARAMARVAAKAGVAQAGEELMEEMTGEEDGCASEGFGALLSLLGAAAEQADLRGWLTLPARIHAVRIRLPAGTHDVVVERDGVRWEVIRDVEIVAGGVELRFAYAP